MNEATDLLLLSVAAAAKEEGKYLDIYQAIGRMTLQVVGTTAFGYALNPDLVSQARFHPLPAGFAPILACPPTLYNPSGHKT